MNFKTKPRGEWANFLTECWRCGHEITVSNARPDPHDCPTVRTLDDIRF